MLNFGRKICCVIFCCVLICTAVYAAEKNATKHESYSWDFSDCQIRDILYVVSLDTGISIVSDDTVSGRADFRFSGKDFETAFDSFLKAARLFVFKGEEVWTVSRFRMEEHDGLFFLDAYDLSAEQIVEKMCLGLGKAVTYEVLPAGLMSVHFSGLSEQELLESFCRRLNGFELERKNTGYHLVKKTNGSVEKNSGFGYMDVHVLEDGGYFVDIRDSKISEVLEAVFAQAGIYGGEKKQFCVMTNSDSRINRMCFMARDFDDALERICVNNGLGCYVEEGVYYVVSGNAAKKWHKLSLEFMAAERFVSVLSRRFGGLNCVVLPDEMSFLVCADEREFEEVLAFKDEVDIKTDIYLVELKYIRPDEFVKYLPPGVDKDCLFFADDNSSVFFKGTEAAYLSLCEQLKICDRPVVRVSYDLLILQYDEGSENAWNPNFSARRIAVGDRNDFGVKLGSVLNLNLNVVSAFGLDFAAQLQTSLEENKTTVFADTTIHGVAGKQINFQNTNTYRYRDNNLDPSTGKPVYSGVTKEIVSGLKLEVTGLVSGDGMITSTVKASVTRQGLDTSSSTGNPPPTSEKIVTTEVCGKSGEPIVISGLIQNSETASQNGVPLFSKIPLLGNLFKSKEKIREQSQMVIYLIPHIEDYSGSNDEQSSGSDIAFEYFNTLLEKLYGGALYEGL
ncbi:MAG: type II and III secretion system protein [Treponema sp.]|nr:type II and III secretion system protein [Treponema sp.]